MVKRGRPADNSSRQVARRTGGSPLQQVCQYYARQQFFPVDIVRTIVEMGYNFGSTRSNPIIIEDDDETIVISSDEEDVFFDHLDQEALEAYWNNIAAQAAADVDDDLPPLEDDSEIVTWESELDVPGTFFMHWFNQ